jgi:hypothetical protein
MRDATVEADEPGVVASSVSMLRLMVAWACIAVGLLNLAMGVDVADWPYLVFHVMLLVSGLSLLAFGMLRRRPGPVAWCIGAVLTVAGLVLSALPRIATVCCMGGYRVRHGFPFSLLAHGEGGWHFDPGRATADLIFWAGAGLLALLLVTALRRGPIPVDPAPERPYATHAEDRTPAPRDENVGGLP